MNDRFFSLQLFARVARSGSFSVAGREMGVSQPTASRIVAALEKQIGVALLVRTTRAVTLTEAGSDYLSRIEPILTALEEADHAARGTGERQRPPARPCNHLRSAMRSASLARLSHTSIGRTRRREACGSYEDRCALVVNSHSSKVVDHEAHDRDRRQSLNPIPRRF